MYRSNESSFGLRICLNFLISIDCMLLFFTIIHCFISSISLILSTYTCKFQIFDPIENPEPPYISVREKMDSPHSIKPFSVSFHFLSLLLNSLFGLFWNHDGILLNLTSLAALFLSRHFACYLSRLDYSGVLFPSLSSPLSVIHSPFWAFNLSLRCLLFSCCCSRFVFLGASLGLSVGSRVWKVVVGA